MRERLGDGLRLGRRGGLRLGRRSGFAIGLQLAEQGEIALDVALDAVFVEGEELEILALGEPDAGLGEGRVHFFVAGGGAIVAGEAEGKDGAFDGGSALETPAVVGDGLHEVGLHGSDGGEGLVDAAAVFLIGRLVGGREDVDLTGQSVAVSVEGAGIAPVGVGFREHNFLVLTNTTRAPRKICKLLVLLRR